MPIDKSTGTLVTAAAWNLLLGTTGSLSETAPGKVTTAGDTVYATGAGTLARRAIGATNAVYQVVAGVPAWVTSPTIPNDLTVTGTLSVKAGLIGLGGAVNTAANFIIQGNSAATGTSQWGAVWDLTFPVGATVQAAGFQVRVNAAASLATANLVGAIIQTPSLGGGASATTVTGLKIDSQAGGTTNYGIKIDAPTGGTTAVGLLNGGTTDLVGYLLVRDTFGVALGSVASNRAAMGYAGTVLLHGLGSDWAEHRWYTAGTQKLSLTGTVLTLTGQLAVSDTTDLTGYLLVRDAFGIALGTVAANNAALGYSSTALLHGLGSNWTAQRWYVGGVEKMSLTASGFSLALLTTAGDLLYGTGSGATARLAAVATGQVLISQGVGVAPVWGAPPVSSLSVELTSAVTLTPSTGTWIDILSLSVPAGTWIFLAQCFVDASTATSGGDLFAQIFNATDVLQYSDYQTVSVYSAYSSVTLTPITIPIVLTATKTIKLRAANGGVSGTVSVNPATVMFGSGPPNQTGGANKTTRLVAIRLA